MKSSYSLRNITNRTQYADGSTVKSGPDVSTTYPLGYFREDYQYNATSSVTPDYLDEHNGRFCITPEYPKGIYCYFATVDQNFNSAYPYAVGPTFYGVKNDSKVTSISETVSTFTPNSAGITKLIGATPQVQIYPNPSSDLIAVQLNDLNRENLLIELVDLSGKVVQSTNINPGSTIAYFDTKTIYAGAYLIRVSNKQQIFNQKILITK